MEEDKYFFNYHLNNIYFLNTCSGRRCFLIANQIAHLATPKPIKFRVKKQSSRNLRQVPAQRGWNYFSFEFSEIWQKILKVYTVEIYDSLRKELHEEEFD